MQKSMRMKKELDRLRSSIPPGIKCWLRDENNMDILDASVAGMEGTPYHNGVFKLELRIPENYPFEPPNVKFITRVYHPNVDENGRICLDLLKLPPQGTWRPVVFLGGLLTSVQLLLGNPNPNDPLVPEIADEYLYNKAEYERKASEFTRMYAVG